MIWQLSILYVVVSISVQKVTKVVFHSMSKKKKIALYPDICRRAIGLQTLSRQVSTGI